MARSSDRVATWGGRPSAWFTAGITGLIGVSMIVIGLADSDRRVLNLTIGVMMSSVSVMMVAAGTARLAGWQRVDNGRGWVLPLSGRQTPTLPVAIVCLVFAGGLAVATVSVDSVGVAVMLASVGAFMLVVGLEMLRVWLRRPRLVVTADRLELRGPGVDAELGWNDVGTIDYVGLGTRWAAIGVRAARDATTYRCRTSRLLLPMDREPETPGLEIRIGVIPDAPALLGLLRAMSGADRAGRQAMLSRGLPEDSGLGARGDMPQP